MRRLAFAILALALSSGAASAQTAQDSWEKLKQLQPGHKVRVVHMNLSAWDGRLVSVSDEAITIRAEDQDITVVRADLLRVTDLERSKRARNALLGLAIGSALGVAVVAKEEDIAPSGKAVIAIGVFGGIGAAVGAAIPHPRPTVYRSKHQTKKLDSNQQ